MLIFVTKFYNKIQFTIAKLNIVLYNYPMDKIVFNEGVKINR